MDSNNPYRPPADSSGSPPERPPGLPSSPSGQRPNPWFTIWKQPRATIQYIVDTNPQNSVLVLSAIAGIGQLLSNASARSLGDNLDMSTILLIALVVGPISGIIGLYLGGLLLRWTGSWMDGKGSAENVRAALAWSNVPLIWAMLLWLPELALFGGELFTSGMPEVEASETLPSLLLLFGLIEIVIAVWAFVVFLQCLGQVQGFSAWKALGNAILAMLFVFAVVIVVGMVLGVMGGLFR